MNHTAAARHAALYMIVLLLLLLPGLSFKLDAAPKYAQNIALLYTVWMTMGMIGLSLRCG